MIYQVGSRLCALNFNKIISFCMMKPMGKHVWVFLLLRAVYLKRLIGWILKKGFVSDFFLKAVLEQYFLVSKQNFWTWEGSGVDGVFSFKEWISFSKPLISSSPSELPNNLIHRTRRTWSFPCHFQALFVHVQDLEVS